MRKMWMFVAILSLIGACAPNSSKPKGTPINMTGTYSIPTTLTNETAEETLWSRSMTITVGQGNRGVDFGGLMFEALDDRIVTSYCLDEPWSENFEYFVRTCYDGELTRKGGTLWIEIGTHVQGESTGDTTYRYDFETLEKQENPYVDG